LSACRNLEFVDLMGTSTGDAGIRALGRLPQLNHLKTGRLVTDAGLEALHDLPAFTHSMSTKSDLSNTFLPEQNALLLDGPFTDDGVRTLTGLTALSALRLFWHATEITPRSLAELAGLRGLEFLG